ncbi:hypothetical protein SVIOM74S_00497 [Streptomyces violarus]
MDGADAEVGVEDVQHRGRTVAEAHGEPPDFVTTDDQDARLTTPDGTTAACTGCCDLPRTALYALPGRTGQVTGSWQLPDGTRARRVLPFCSPALAPRG